MDPGDRGRSHDRNGRRNAVERPRRRRGDDGFVAGAEVLALGVLVLVVGTLLVANVWGVIDARLSAESAAEAASRAYVEARDEATGVAAGTSAALAALGDDARRVRVVAPPGGSFVRCAEPSWTVEVDVPVLRLPFGAGIRAGVLTARASHAERVDPYRSGVGEADGAPASC